jgi:putative FmdB family regulatory protein
MPTYEYQCANGHHFERVQKMSDEPVAKCPECGAQASRKISGGQGLIFKGSGFYITDYGKDGKGARKESDAAPKADPPTSKKADAAPAAATPAPKSSGSADAS